MDKTSIIVPTDALPSIVNLMTNEIARLTDLLNTKGDKLNTAQYRISELSNQVESLKEENKRLWAMYQNKEEF